MDGAGADHDKQPIGGLGYALNRAEAATRDGLLGLDGLGRRYRVRGFGLRVEQETYGRYLALKKGRRDEWILPEDCRETSVTATADIVLGCQLTSQIVIGVYLTLVDSHSVRRCRVRELAAGGAQVSRIGGLIDLGRNQLQAVYLMLTFSNVKLGVL